jgi:hypothetical protein
MIRRKRGEDMRRVSVRLLLIVLAGLLTSYLAMAATARRLISRDEYTIYSNAIVRAAVGHADEAGGLRALAYARAALAEPALTAQISSSVPQVVIPLPPHTARQLGAGRGPDRYVSFATDAEMVVYLTQTMPQAGWQYVDQMGGGHIFSSGARVVALSQRYLLSRAIRSLTIRGER